MNKAFITGHCVPVAGNWNELTREQLLRLMQVLQRPGVTDDEVNTRLVAILLQLWKRPHLAGIMRRMPLLDVATLRLLTRAFLDQPVQLTKQLLPTLTYNKMFTVYGPGDNLTGFTYEEWIAAEGAYFQYREGGKPEHLAQLLAVLYRPGRRKAQPNGDRREEYNQYTLDARAAQLAKLPAHMRLAVWFYYDSCRAVLMRQNPDLFKGKEYDDDPDPVPTNPTRNYLELLDELAGSPVHYDATGKQPVQNIFFSLNKKIGDADRRAEAMEEQAQERSNG